VKAGLTDCVVVLSPFSIDTMPGTSPPTIYKIGHQDFNEYTHKKDIREKEIAAMPLIHPTNNASGLHFDENKSHSTQTTTFRSSTTEFPIREPQRRVVDYSRIGGVGSSIRDNIDAVSKHDVLDVFRMEIV
jgi:hypothetical protein